MPHTKENHTGISRSDFIRYLLNEGIRHGAHKSPLLYPSIIKFINSPEGIAAFEKFRTLNPLKLGVTIRPVSREPKRIQL